MRYSSRGQLAAVKDESDAPVAAYKYDALGRRYQKTAGNETTYFLHDTLGRVAAEYASTDPNAAPVRWFIYGDGVEPLAMLQEPDEPNGLGDFLGVAETWLADANDVGYNAAYDFDSSGIVDMNDFAIRWTLSALVPPGIYAIY